MPKNYLHINNTKEIAKMNNKAFLFKMLDKNSQLLYTFNVCGGGEIGRRAGLRSLWVTPYEFKSRPPHQTGTN